MESWIFKWHIWYFRYPLSDLVSPHNVQNQADSECLSSIQGDYSVFYNSICYSFSRPWGVEMGWHFPLHSPKWDFSLDRSYIWEWYQDPALKRLQESAYAQVEPEWFWRFRKEDNGGICKSLLLICFHSYHHYTETSILWKERFPSEFFRGLFLPSERKITAKFGNDFPIILIHHICSSLGRWGMGRRVHNWLSAVFHPFHQLIPLELNALCRSEISCFFIILFFTE